jgi:hypothetical protein
MMTKIDSQKQKSSVHLRVFNSEEVHLGVKVVNHETVRTLWAKVYAL